MANRLVRAICTGAVGIVGLGIAGCTVEVEPNEDKNSTANQHTLSSATFQGGKYLDAAGGFGPSDTVDWWVFNTDSTLQAGQYNVGFAVQPGLDFYGAFFAPGQATKEVTVSCPASATQNCISNPVTLTLRPNVRNEWFFHGGSPAHPLTNARGYLFLVRKL